MCSHPKYKRWRSLTAERSFSVALYVWCRFIFGIKSEKLRSVHNAQRQKKNEMSKSKRWSIRSLLHRGTQGDMDQIIRIFLIYQPKYNFFCWYQTKFDHSPILPPIDRFSQFKERRSLRKSTMVTLLSPIFPLYTCIIIAIIRTLTWISLNSTMK